jgi:hypothetical protein
MSPPNEFPTDESPGPLYMIGYLLMSSLFLSAFIFVFFFFTWFLSALPVIDYPARVLIARWISELISILRKIERILFAYSCTATIRIYDVTGISLLACRLLATFVFIVGGLAVIVITVILSVRAVRAVQKAWSERYWKAAKTE